MILAETCVVSLSFVKVHDPKYSLVPLHHIHGEQKSAEVCLSLCEGS